MEYGNWVRWLGRGLAALAIAILLAVAFAGWYVYGAWPEPDGYDFPRHSLWGGGPLALFEGVLVEQDGCIRSAGPGEQYTVVWPPGYHLAVKDGVEILGGSKPIQLGEPVRMGGGYYEAGDPPPTAFNIGNCPAPYFLSTGLIDSER